MTMIAALYNTSYIPGLRLLLSLRFPCHRPFVPSASVSTSTSIPIVELREYELYPSKSSHYRELATAKWEQQSRQRQLHSPLKCSLYPDTGSSILNEAFHLYHFAGGYDERDRLRAIMGKNEDWQQYSQTIKSCCARQKSAIFIQAPLVRDMGVMGLSPPRDNKSKDAKSKSSPSKAIFEVRRYQLQPGYDTVPHFLSLYRAGLPSKLHAATETDPSASLVTLLYSDVGSLNHIIEIWRHGNGSAAMERARVAARQANEWRHATAEISVITQQISTAIYRPYVFSNMQ